MASPARSVAYQLLSQIDLEGAFSDNALNSKPVAELEPRDRNLVTEIVYGTLRWQALLDFVLAQASSRPWNEISPGIRTLLRMSLYQMWRMARIPDYALVNDAVELAKRHFKRGSEGFINAVLRNLARRQPWKEEGFDRDFPPWVRVSLPSWLWDRWVGRFGESRAREYALSLNEPPRSAIRLENVSEVPREVVVEIADSDLVPGAYIRKEAGSFDERWRHLPLALQDEASQLIPHLFGPTVGWRIWDACAAPGGKSAILCRKGGSSGWLVASDLDRVRVNRLGKSLGALGTGKVSVLVADAAAPPFLAQFDAVLADVPCSGLGTLRRNPEIKWRFDLDRLKVLQKVQFKLLTAIVAAVGPHGLLLYSTCSTEPEENEQVVDLFLREHTEFKLIRPEHPPGIEGWTDRQGLVRTFPSTRLWDGFFAALMVRSP